MPAFNLAKRTPLGRRFFGKLALLFLLFAMFYSLIDYYAREKLKNTFCSAAKAKYEEITRPQVNAEVIVLGASIAEMGINPKYLELIFPKIFNFAYSGSGASFYKEWYRRVFKPYYNKPKLILYGVHPAFNESTGRKFEQDSAHFPPNVFVKALFDFRLSQRHLLFNRMYAKLFFDDTQFTTPKIRKHYYKGYLPANTASLRKGTIGVGNTEEQLQSLQELGNFIDVLKADGVAVVLIGMPSYSAIPTDQLKLIQQGFKLVEEFAAKKRVLFINYNHLSDPLNTDPKFYTDPLHLAASGAQELSMRLCQDMATFMDPSQYHSAYDLGNYFFARNKFSEAIPFYIKAIQENPASATAAYQLGRAYYGLRLYPQAISMCSRAIALNPQMEEAYRVLSKIYYDSGNAPQAFQMNEKIFSLDPYDPDILIETGVLQTEAGVDPQKSIPLFESAIRINPNYEYAYYCMGVLFHYALKDYGQALYFYEKTLECSATYVPALVNGGVIYSMIGNQEKAIEFFERGYRLNDFQAGKNLAIVYVQQKKYAEAMQVIRDMTPLHGSQPELKHILEYIPEKFR